MEVRRRRKERRLHQLLVFELVVHKQTVSSVQAKALRVFSAVYFFTQLTVLLEMGEEPVRVVVHFQKTSIKKLEFQKRARGRST